MVADGAEEAVRVEVDGADGAVLARCDQHVLGHGHLRAIDTSSLGKFREEATLWGVRSVMMLCVLFFLKFQLPIGQHSSCCISPTAGGTFKKSLTKFYP